MAANPANANKPYDKKDISGIWSRNGSPGGFGGGGTCRDCGDHGFSNEVPPLTPLGQKMFDANMPSYGRNLNSPEAKAHPEEAIGRRRAVPPANGTDPYQTCNPEGIPRALIYPDPMEMNVLPNKIMQQFEWGYAVRTIWTDGAETSHRSRPGQVVGIFGRPLGRRHFRRSNYGRRRANVGRSFRVPT